MIPLMLGDREFFQGKQVVDQDPVFVRRLLPAGGQAAKAPARCPLGTIPERCWCFLRRSPELWCWGCPWLPDLKSEAVGIFSAAHSFTSTTSPATRDSCRPSSYWIFSAPLGRRRWWWPGFAGRGDHANAFAVGKGRSRFPAFGDGLVATLQQQLVMALNFPEQSDEHLDAGNAPVRLHAQRGGNVFQFRRASGCDSR